MSTVYPDTSAMIPPGTIWNTIAAAAPMGWSLLDGSTLTDCQNLHRGLWEVAPPAWRSGANLVLPDWRGRTLIGAGTGPTLTNRVLGSTGGAETHTLTTAEMPSHTHVQNSHVHTQVAHTHVQTAHTHLQDSHNHTQLSHTHTIDHDHASFTSDSDTHSHTGVYSVNIFPDTTSWVFTTGTGYQNANGSIAANTHSHTVNVPAYSGSSGSATPTNQAATASNQSTTAVNQASTPAIDAATATNQTAGTGGAHANMQPWAAVNVMIKL